MSNAPALSTAERTRTAYHESGHVLAYLYWRRQSADDSTGSLHSLPHRTSPLRQAAACLCGPAAESTFYKQLLSHASECVAVGNKTCYEIDDRSLVPLSCRTIPLERRSSATGRTRFTMQLRKPTCRSGGLRNPRSGNCSISST